MSWDFDAKGKTWGATILRPTDKDLPGLKMKYLCEAPNGKTGRLLEIGSSAGKHLRSLLALRYPFECHGNDIDIDSIKLGHRMTPSAEFVRADGHRLPYRSESFDAVLVFDVLEHVRNPKAVIEETRRVLRDGGTLCMFIPCEGNSFSIYALFKRVFGFNVKKPTGGHIQDFSLTDIIDITVVPGYKVKSTYYSYHVLGSLMDFALFLLAYLSKSVYTLYWRHNKFYYGDKRGGSVAVSCFNSALACLNRIAFLESCKLRKTSSPACGIHIAAIRAGR